MGYASRAGRARTSASSPVAQAICQRCGIWYSYTDLHFQFDYRGSSLQNLYIRVCTPCTDIAQDQLRSISIPPDPVPVVWATPEYFEQDETNYRAVNVPPQTDPTTGIPIPSDTLLLTQGGQNVTTQPIGEPNGLDPNAIVPLLGTTHYDVQLTVLSVAADALGNVNVVCKTPHGMMTNDQVSVLGLTNHAVEGFYSVTVQSVTAFSYLPLGPIGVGSLLTPATKIVTAKVGLPLGYDQIPLV